MPASLTVLAGPLTGTRVDVEEVVEEILVGSDPDCRLCLDLPGVSPIHARVWLDSDGVTVHDTRAPRGVYVNDTRVEGQAPLRDGDVLWLGAPGDESSVMIGCRLGSIGDYGVAPAAAAVGGSGGAVSPQTQEARPIHSAAPEDEFFFDAPLADLEPPAPTAAAADPVDITSLVSEPSGGSGGAASPQTPEPQPIHSVAPENEFFVEPLSQPEFHFGAPAVPPGGSGGAVSPQTQEARPIDSAAPEDPIFFGYDFGSLVDSPAVAASGAPAPSGGSGGVASPQTQEAQPIHSAAPSGGSGGVASPQTQEARPIHSAAPEDAAEFFVDEPVIPAAPAAPVPPPVAARPAAPTAPPPAPHPVSATAAPPPAARPQAARPAASAPAPPSERPARRPPAERPVAARPAPRATASTGSSPLVRYGAIGVVVLLLLGIAAFFGLRTMSAPVVASVQPPRAGPGQTVTLAGSHFASTGSGNVVRIGGKPARVLQAAPDRLEVEVPDLPGTPGRDTAAPVVVSVDGRESQPVSLAVYQAPRIHGISPTVAMPGDTVVLAGGGWSPGVTVKFGDHAAAVVEVAPAAMKVTVPDLEGPIGREYPVTVAMGADPSNAAPFVMGRLPLVSATQPARAAPGEVVTITGRGFVPNAVANDVRVSGVRALVLTSSNSELKVVVPRVPAGDVAVQVKVPGSENVGQSALTVNPLPDPADFYFVAEPFEDSPGHEHAALTTALGPAFVLSSSGGRTAAQRAVEAAGRLNATGANLKGSVDADLRVQGQESSPRMIESGRDVALFDITSEDALAYEEDWTGLRGRGEPVTRGRLAVWWEAVGRDLVLLLARTERPHYAADLAPEGRVLQEIHSVARKAVPIGLPRQVLQEARPALRDALRIVGLRVPPNVKEPDSQQATAAAPTAGLKLEGRWMGIERDAAGARRITAVFGPGGGSLTFERGIAITVPMIGVVEQRGTVRFSLHTGAGPRFYRGRWDGQKIAGNVYADEAGTTELGTFELTTR